MILLTYVDLVNTAGVSMILLAFFLQTFRLLKSDTVVFYLLNFFGAGLACYGSWLLKVIPFVVLEGTWAIVALVGLLRLMTVKKDR